MLGDERVGATPEVGGGVPIMVGASQGVLPPKSTMVGESELCEPTCRGTSINVGESEGEIPEEELSPGLGVRTPAPPGSGALSGDRPLESSSIRLPFRPVTHGSLTISGTQAQRESR